MQHIRVQVVRMTEVHSLNVQHLILFAYQDSSKISSTPYCRTTSQSSCGDGKGGRWRSRSRTRESLGSSRLSGGGELGEEGFDRKATTTDPYLITHQKAVVFSLTTYDLPSEGESDDDMIPTWSKLRILIHLSLANLLLPQLQLLSPALGYDRSFQDHAHDQAHFDDPAGCVPPVIDEERVIGHQGKAMILNKVCLEQVMAKAKGMALCMASDRRGPSIAGWPACHAGCRPAMQLGMNMQRMASGVPGLPSQDLNPLVISRTTSSSMIQPSWMLQMALTPPTSLRLISKGWVASSTQSNPTDSRGTPGLV